MVHVMVMRAEVMVAGNGGSSARRRRFIVHLQRQYMRSWPDRQKPVQRRAALAGLGRDQLQISAVSQHHAAVAGASARMHRVWREVKPQL